MAPTATREGRRRAKGMERRWELKGGGAAACTISSGVSEDMFILRICVVPYSRWDASLELEMELELDVSAFAQLWGPAKLGSLLPSGMPTAGDHWNSLHHQTPTNHNNHTHQKYIHHNTHHTTPKQNHARLFPSTTQLVPALQTQPHNHPPTHRRPTNPRLSARRTPRRPPSHAPRQHLQRHNPRKHPHSLPTPRLCRRHRPSQTHRSKRPEQRLGSDRRRSGRRAHLRRGCREHRQGKGQGERCVFFYSGCVVVEEERCE